MKLKITPQAKLDCFCTRKKSMRALTAQPKPVKWVGRYGSFISLSYELHASWDSPYVCCLRYSNSGRLLNHEKLSDCSKESVVHVLAAEHRTSCLRLKGFLTTSKLLLKLSYQSTGLTGLTGLTSLWITLSVHKPSLMSSHVDHLDYLDWAWSANE